MLHTSPTEAKGVVWDYVVLDVTYFMFEFLNNLYAPFYNK